MKIQFTIHGNHEDPAGNPIPKARLTLRQQWTDKAERYALWKEHVRSAYYQTMNVNGNPVIIDDRLEAREFTLDDNLAKETKPIQLSKAPARMDIKIFWKNRAHGDPENVFGSIADALFANDKNLDGSFTSHMSQDAKGRVEVEIRIIEATKNNF